MVLYENSIISTFSAAATAVDEIVNAIKEKCGLEKPVLFRISFMLREVINNAVEHGNLFDESKKVEIVVECFETYMLFKIKDEGPGFSLEVLNHIPDQHLRVRNRGILLVKEFGFELDVVNKIVMVNMPLNHGV